jgi:hypothetical protein
LLAHSKCRALRLTPRAGGISAARCSASRYWMQLHLVLHPTSTIARAGGALAAGCFESRHWMQLHPSLHPASAPARAGDNFGAECSASRQCNCIQSCIRPRRSRAQALPDGLDLVLIEDCSLKRKPAGGTCQLKAGAVPLLAGARWSFESEPFSHELKRLLTS